MVEVKERKQRWLTQMRTKLVIDKDKVGRDRDRTLWSRSKEAEGRRQKRGCSRRLRQAFYDEVLFK